MTKRIIVGAMATLATLMVTVLPAAASTGVWTRN